MQEPKVPPSEALTILKEMTPRLPDMVAIERNPNVEYEVQEGSCFGLALLNKPGVAVQLAIISGGATFPVHDHSSVEFLIVYRGKLLANGQEIGVGESVCFPPGEPHSVYAVEDTRMIGITVPAEEGYPHE